MAKFKKRIKARELRRQGKSLLMIARHLNVSKSSVSLWCRDTPLTELQMCALSKNALDARIKGRLIGVEANRQRKREMVNQCAVWSKNIFNTFSERDLFIAGIALYWAEGSKKSPTHGFLFVNSDPMMILFMYEWLKRVFNVKKEEMCPRLAINEMHKPRIKKVVEFWSDLLQLPASQLGTPWFVRTKIKKVYENYDSYYGILRLGVRKSVALKYKMLSLIDILSNFKKLPM